MINIFRSTISDINNNR